MRCPDKKKITLFYYGELPVAAAENISRHLAGCPVCAGYYRDLQTDFVAEPPRKEENIDYAALAATVRERAQIEHVSPRRWFDDFATGLFRAFLPPMKLASVLAAVVLVVAVYPTYHRMRANYDFKVLQIQLELSSSPDSDGAFDLNDDDELIDALSQS